MISPELINSTAHTGPTMTYTLPVIASALDGLSKSGDDDTAGCVGSVGLERSVVTTRLVDEYVLSCSVISILVDTVLESLNTVRSLVSDVTTLESVLMAVVSTPYANVRVVASVDRVVGN